MNSRLNKGGVGRREINSHGKVPADTDAKGLAWSDRTGAEE